MRGTWRGTLTVARVVNEEARITYGRTKSRVKKTYRAWKRERNFTADDMPEEDEIPAKRRRLGRTQFLCLVCGRKYRSAYGLNQHFRRVHDGKERPPPSARPRILGGGNLQKVRVRPTANRSTQAAPKKKSSQRSANPVNSTIAQALKAAWSRMAEARPYKLSEIRDDMVGLEQALGGFAAEGIAQYRAHLIRNVGFNPITVQRLVKATEQLEEAGQSFSAVIAAIDEYYADDIAAAKKRKGGERPSDSTLTS